MKTLDERKAEVDSAVKDIADYICSRGDTIQLREETERRARGYLHALAQKGWSVTKSS